METIEYEPLTKEVLDKFIKSLNETPLDEKDIQNKIEYANILLGDVDNCILIKKDQKFMGELSIHKERLSNYFYQNMLETDEIDSYDDIVSLIKFLKENNVLELEKELWSKKIEKRFKKMQKKTEYIKKFKDEYLEEEYEKTRIIISNLSSKEYKKGVDYTMEIIQMVNDELYKYNKEMNICLRLYYRNNKTFVKEIDNRALYNNTNKMINIYSILSYKNTISLAEHNSRELSKRLFPSDKVTRKYENL